MDVEIERLSKSAIDEFSHLIKIYEEVFDRPNASFLNKPHLQRVLDNPDFLVFVAKTDNKIVGGLTAYVLDRYDSESRSAYIFDLAVSTDQQRKGIGKLLIATFNQYCKDNGFSETFVQAETEDSQAVNFYRTTDISDELQATHFTYSFNHSG